jgi:membrane protease YdiL (CAAX protease family)
LKRIFNKWLALILTAMLFALAHVVVDGQPMRLLVFFPGLLFGWLKHRSTSIVPGILFHALCNLIYIALPVMNHR